MNNNSNNISSKHKRRQRSTLSSSSSGSSVSSGESDSSFNKCRRSKNSSKDNNNNKSKGTNGTSKSFFSVFWSDAEIEDNENSTVSRSYHNHNGGNNEGRIYYEGFYLTVGDTIYEIGVDDVVAMRNSVEPVGHESEDDNRKQQEPMPMHMNNVENPFFSMLSILSM